MPSNVAQKNFTIAAAGTVSTGVDLGGSYIAALLLPNNLVPTNITFQGSMDNVTYYAIYDSSGAAVTLSTVAASTAVAIDMSFTFGFPYLKLVAGTTQTNGAIITALLKA